MIVLFVTTTLTTPWMLTGAVDLVVVLCIAFNTGTLLPPDFRMELSIEGPRYCCWMS